MAFTNIKNVFAVLLSVAALSCSDYRLSKIPTEPVPDINVTPDAIDYGSVFAGVESAAADITITNVGTADLELDAVVLMNGDLTFNAHTEYDNLLSPGDSTTVTVDYSPVTYSLNFDTIGIYSNDPDEPYVEIELAGAGDAPVINVDPDIYLCCCGGGGLIAGTSTYLKDKFKDIKSFSVEPFGFDDTKKSLNSGKILSNEKGHKSICDAIITPQPGNLTFPINLKNLEDGLVVNDDQVKNSIKILAEHLKIVVEPGGAVAATAALTEKIDLKNKTVVVMISGGNIDLEMFRSL